MSFSKRLINLLGMSQEDEPFLGGGVRKGEGYTDGCVRLHLLCLCVCVHMPALICVHFISMKAAHLKKKKKESPGCWTMCS